MKKLSFLTIIMTFSSLFLNAQIINIPADYPTIQDGINASTNGDTVLVQPGIYQENIIYNGKNIVLGSKFLTTSDTSFISSTIIDGGGYNIYRESVVRIINGENSNAQLVGFRIQNGNLENKVGHNGAGICISGDPKVRNYHIINNITDEDGGGIYLYNSNSEIINCDITNNVALNYGSGIGGWGGNPKIINCRILNNNGASWGAGVGLRVCDTLKIVNSIIADNSGGLGSLVDNVGIYMHNGNCLLMNSTIANQEIGLFLHSYMGNINSSIVNSIMQNDNDILFSEVYELSYTNIYNSIIDTSTIQYYDQGQIVDELIDVIITFSNLINLNPRFVDAESGNFMLKNCSPAIGSGLTNSPLSNLSVPNNDILNNTRPGPIGSNPDIGAYENELGIPLIPPSITNQPDSTSICENGSYTLTIEAQGTPVLYYQWQKDNVDIVDETNSYLILNNLTQSDQANYRCMISNSCETILSNNAFINVLAPPSVTQQPQDNFAYVGNDISFEFEVSGDEPLSFQWYGPNGILSGDTLAYLLLTNLSYSDTGYYYCTINNACGLENTNNVHLTIYEPLVANAGSDMSIQVGGNTTLNGSYQGGSPSIGYYWSPDSLLINPYILNPQTINMFTSQTFTLIVTDSLVDYQNSDNMLLTVIENDTLNYPDFGNDTLYEYNVNRSYCGFVSGNNCDNDLIKAQYYYDDLKLFEMAKFHLSQHLFVSLQNEN